MARTAFEDEFIDRWAIELVMIPVAERATACRLTLPQIKDWLRREFPDLSEENVVKVGDAYLTDIILRAVEIDRAREAT